MRLWILSDIHTEFEPYRLPEKFPEVDVAVIAGDFGIGGVTRALEWLDRNLPPAVEVVFVAGNHDFYDVFHSDAIRDGRKASALMRRVHFLENDTTMIRGVTFIGCTLWTDFSLLGSRELSMWEAAKGMNDHRRIKQSKRPFSKFTPLVALRTHQGSRQYLERSLEAADHPVVVISHHAPSPSSIPHRYKGHRLSPAYASNLDQLILRHRPTLWVHGHIHDPVDYRLGETRVVSNPMGYPGENTRFSELVIEV